MTAVLFSCVGLCRNITRKLHATGHPCCSCCSFASITWYFFGFWLYQLNAALVMEYTKQCLFEPVNAVKTNEFDKFTSVFIYSVDRL